MAQARDTILLAGGAAAHIVWSDHDDEGAIRVTAAWLDASSNPDRKEAKQAACGRSGRPEMTWVFVIVPEDD